MQVLLWSSLFVGGLVVLLFASDRFVKSAEIIGLRLNDPAFVLGVLVLAIGTSLPELFTAIISVTKDSSEIVSGTVAGSNIANILFVMGLATLFAKKGSASFKTQKIDVLFFAGSPLVFLLVAYDGGISLIEGCFLLAILAVYMWHVLSVNMPSINDEPGESLFYAVVIFVLGLAGVYIGSEMLIRSVIKLSILAGIPSEIIAASAVAFGTSVPELAVSIIAARRGNLAMSDGNVIGSNIFNILGVAGAAS